MQGFLIQKKNTNYQEHAAKKPGNGCHGKHKGKISVWSKNELFNELELINMENALDTIKK
jgi:hypothetical protein